MKNSLLEAMEDPSANRRLPPIPILYPSQHQNWPLILTGVPQRDSSHIKPVHIKIFYEITPIRKIRGAYIPERRIRSR
jgi:hypothetical protein